MSQPIEFTEEQRMLLDTAMDFCGKHSPVSLVRARLGDEQTIPARSGRKLLILAGLRSPYPRSMVVWGWV